ncbi:MAG: DUF3419 family protein [Saprospiraceae bacterium]
MKHLHKVQLDFVRYANVWEDAQLLRQGLRIQPGERVLSIGSAGDNCLALLADDPSLVVAADLNQAQLYLIELKMAAIRELDYGSLLGFLGFATSAAQRVNRLKIYAQLSPLLSEDARRFWDSQSSDVEAGVAHSGKFERYFQMFAHRILPFIHSQKTVEALLAPKSAEAQRDFYHEKWNTWRWRLLFKLFFSRFVMGKFGRDPAFLKEVNLSVGEYIFQKAAAQLSKVQAQHNPILRYNLTGSFGHLLPDYLADETQLRQIRERLGRLRLFKGFAQDAGELHGPFDAMNLSDIFEYMDEGLFADTGRRLGQISNPGCRIGYWNLMVPRRLSHTLPELFRYDDPLSSQLTAQDRGFFYNKFIVDKSLG